MAMIALLVVLQMPAATVTRTRTPPAVDAARERAYIRRLLPNVPPLDQLQRIDLGRVFERMEFERITQGADR